MAVLRQGPGRYAIYLCNLGTPEANGWASFYVQAYERVLAYVSSGGFNRVTIAQVQPGACKSGTSTRDLDVGSYRLNIRRYSVQRGSETPVRVVMFQGSISQGTEVYRGNVGGGSTGVNINIEVPSVVGQRLLERTGRIEERLKEGVGGGAAVSTEPRYELESPPDRAGRSYRSVRELTAAQVERYQQIGYKVRQVGSSVALQGAVGTRAPRAAVERPQRTPRVLRIFGGPSAEAERTPLPAPRARHHQRVVGELVTVNQRKTPFGGVTRGSRRVHR